MNNATGTFELGAPPVAWLGQGACRDCAALGGKAANLCHLAVAYRVPPGFCLTATAFDVAAADGWAVADRPSAASVPSPFSVEVTAAYRTLGQRCGVDTPSVAVRSSALDEDGAVASFAGQHESYLNVVGADAVLDAVIRCFASVRSPRAMEYRRQQGLAFDGARIAVLVQQLVPADISAVVFSANPVTGSRGEVVINASWGLGETIVGGTVTPDTYTVRKSDMTLLSRQIGEKGRMAVPVSGGTHEVDVPRFLRGRPTLTEAQASEMARLGVALEERMGHPVDVECAYHAGQLYVLQCRPITALAGPR